MENLNSLSREELIALVESLRTSLKVSNQKNLDLSDQVSKLHRGHQDALPEVNNDEYR